MNYKITTKFLITVSLNYASCTIDGSFYPKPGNLTRAGDDPCNPLYWYPREIPEYCYYSTTVKPRPIIRPIPMPIPVPLPVQPFYPPIYHPTPMPVMPPVVPYPEGGPQAVPVPMVPQLPLPFGIPLIPTNPMIPVAGVQYSQFQSPYIPPPPRPVPIEPSIPSMVPQNHVGMIPLNQIGMVPQSRISMIAQSQIGMVPGLPGIVAYDGGINIMPFSDAYSDLLEKHKQKMIRRRLQKFLDEYDRHPWKSHKKIH